MMSPRPWTANPPPDIDPPGSRCSEKAPAMPGPSFGKGFSIRRERPGRSPLANPCGSGQCLALAGRSLLLLQVRHLLPLPPVGRLDPAQALLKGRGRLG